MLRVTGHALGGDGSTLYRTNAGDFILLQTLLGWLMIHETREQVTLFSHVFPDRRSAIRWIEAA